MTSRTSEVHSTAAQITSSSWFRRYRPRSISQLHSDSLRARLSSFLQAGHIPQVLLLTGPRGTGKTSSARILAGVVNAKENVDAVRADFLQRKKSARTAYQDTDPNNPEVLKLSAGQSFLIHEMDAASHRGIDDVRGLKERMYLPPQTGMVSVYLLDEVHMLTTEAFNALLKILEEPPSHVLILLATTEIHKVPDTIISRCTVVSFAQPTEGEIISALEHIASEENLSVPEEVLALVSRTAEGSFRDAVKLLQSLVSAFLDPQTLKLSTLTTQSATAFLSLQPHSEIERFISLILAKDAAGVVHFFESLRKHHTNEESFIGTVLRYLHDSVIASLDPTTVSTTTPSKEVLLFLLKKFAMLPKNTTPIQFLPIELEVLEMIAKSESTNSAKPPRGENGVEKQEKNTPVVQTKNKQARDTEPRDELVPQALTTATAHPHTELEEVEPLVASKLLEEWDRFIESVSEKQHTLALLLKTVQYTIVEGKMQLTVYYPFHKEQLELAKHRKILEESTAELLGKKIPLEVVVSSEVQLPHDETSTQTQKQFPISLAEQILV